MASYQGPTDPNLRHGLTEGYQPVSRIGEVVINAFVYEHTALPDSISNNSVEPIGLTGKDPRINVAGNPNDPNALAVAAAENASFLSKTFETKPHFHEWATVTPGMLCVSRKERNTTFRNLLAAETATPVVACAACLGAEDMRNFFFAGVARSKSVRPVDDGAGPQIDEFFTLAIGGMVSVLNNSGSPVYPGDCLEWTFSPTGITSKPSSKNARGNGAPRRVAIKVSTQFSERAIGRALSFGKNGEVIDVLLKSA